MWAGRIFLWFYKYLLVITFPLLKNKPIDCLVHFLSLSLSLSLSQCFSMEGDYLELSQFTYISHTFPYNSHPIPLGTTRFLTFSFPYKDYGDLELRENSFGGIHFLLNMEKHGWLVNEAG